VWIDCDFTEEPVIFDIDWWNARHKAGLPVWYAYNGSITGASLEPSYLYGMNNKIKFFCKTDDYYKSTQQQTFGEYITSECKDNRQNTCRHYLETKDCTGCNAWNHTTIINKENTMNSTALQQLLTQIFGAPKPETDYDKRPAYLVIAYSADGAQVAQATASSEKDVKLKVQQSPGLWNCKILTYKLDKELSVTVPVTSVKASTASGEPNE
jgi:hypothetical protein